jgi:segregation and condensation protein A
LEQLSIDQLCIVKLDVFEGPLDLLLHLIQKHELDIFDIPMSFVTQKYLEYLDMMRQMNLDLASEYLEMAATLVHIKSKMLLPTPPPEEDPAAEDGPDPREELIRRLLEYQKFKVAADDLQSRPLLGRDTFPRGRGETHIEEDRGIASPGLFALVEAFQKVLARKKPPHVHEVTVARVSLSDRMKQLLDALRDQESLCFTELFEQDATRADLVVTFLALLELTKLGIMAIHQAGTHSEIHLRATEKIAQAAELLASQQPQEPFS